MTPFLGTLGGYFRVLLQDQIWFLKSDFDILISLLILKDQELAILQRKTQADEVELMTLRKATQLQKDGLYNMELKLQHSLEDGSRMKYELDAATAEVIKDCDRKIVEREAELEKEQKAIKVKLINSQYF